MQPDHYFSESPAAISKPTTVTIKVKDRDVILTSDTGVFSHSRIDPGTDVLLRVAPAPTSTGNLLDLGCGYGAIAVTLAMYSPAATVYAVDVNHRAVELTQKNATDLGLINIVPSGADELDVAVRFDAIYCNPPIRIGKDALHELITTWVDRLNPGGTAYLVVQKHLGSDSLAEWLTGRGHVVRRLGSKRAYRVLSVSPRL